MKRKIEEILPEGQETFSPKEVSALIPVNETTVSRWCVANKIECTKPMGRWYITRSAVAKLLVAFGLASHLLATGMQSAAKTIPNTRKIFHENMIQQGKAEGWNTNRS